MGKMGWNTSGGFCTNPNKFSILWTPSPDSNKTVKVKLTFLVEIERENENINHHISIIFYLLSHISLLPFSPPDWILLSLNILNTIHIFIGLTYVCFTYIQHAILLQWLYFYLVPDLCNILRIFLSPGRYSFFFCISNTPFFNVADDSSMVVEGAHPSVKYREKSECVSEWKIFQINFLIKLIPHSVHFTSPVPYAYILLRIIIATFLKILKKKKWEYQQNRLFSLHLIIYTIQHKKYSNLNPYSSLTKRSWL